MWMGNLSTIVIGVKLLGVVSELPEWRAVGDADGRLQFQIATVWTGKFLSRLGKHSGIGVSSHFIHSGTVLVTLDNS